MYTAGAVIEGLLRNPNWSNVGNMAMLAVYSLWVASLLKELENK